MRYNNPVTADYSRPVLESRVGLRRRCLEGASMWNPSGSCERLNPLSIPIFLRAYSSRRPLLNSFHMALTAMIAPARET